MEQLTRPRSISWWVFAAMAVGTFTSVVDNSSLIVALPSVSSYFGTDLPSAQWVVIGYILTISALLLPMGRLSDLVGRKRVYVVGFTIFVVGAVIAGLSANITTLILARVLQGCGAAMTQGTALALIISSFHSSQRGRAIGMELGVVGIGGIVGPALGGVLVDGLGWRWVFFANALLGVISILVATRALKDQAVSPDRRRPAFDVIGATLSSVALVAFLLTMTLGSRTGWSSPFLGAGLAGFVMALGGFIWWELRAPEPMMDLGYFRNRLFSLGVLASFICFLGTSSVRFLMPFYLQSVRDFSPAQVGLIMVPNAVCMALIGPISGRLSDRFGWTVFNVAGLALSATGLFILSSMTESTSLGIVMGAMMVQNLGNGTFYAPNNSSILSTVDRGRYGAVSGFLNLVRNSANVTGVALATSIATATMAASGYPPTLTAVSEAEGAGVRHAFTSGLKIAYLTMGALALAGAVSSMVRGRIASRQP